MAVDFTLLLTELAREFDQQAGPGARDSFLRKVGHRIACRVRLPPCETLLNLELEMNVQLAMLGWGQTSLCLEETQARLRLTHDGLPSLGSTGTPPESWLTACLAGLYEQWLMDQPNAAKGCRITWAPHASAISIESLLFEYGQ
ncbi:cellulose biosynthesis protein BcsD [Gluconobacter thailandicus]|uniref:Cellulose synthase n=1 Tax=Gluconobacter thailandicus TaxID=257438 RepID=A0AAP9EQ59_GLUTH|nr:cellulose biosynthesis protein BcsD [Gluconobacter thailandicus]QEH94920.1 cellulose synthase [Gluconobacter thailandicus]